MHEFTDEIYGAVPQAEEPTQRYTAAVKLLLAEKDRRIQQLDKNSARRQPCGTKGKEREMRNLLPLL